MLSRLRPHAGVMVIASFLILHLLLVNDYGFTWDFHFHFFGGGKLLGLEPATLEPRDLPFVEPDPRRAWTLPYGPLMSIPPVASYLILHNTFKLLPADSSYHIPIILWGVAGMFVLYTFLKEATNARTALFAAFFLGLSPRYFGDLHNNMKDIPSAAAFALNMWLLWRLVHHKRLIDLIVAAAAFAVAFNIKVNSIFIPIIFAAWLFISNLSFSKLRHSLQLSKPIIWYFLFAPVGAFGLWSVFWQHPIAQLDHAYRTFGIGTNNIEVILNGAWYCSGSTVPWYYPYWYLAITTPVLFLAFFLVGLAVSLIQARSRKPIHMLFLLWLILPLTRYLLPSVGVIDGIRHFEEVLFPIAVFAGIGMDYLMTKIRLTPVRRLMVILTLTYAVITVYAYHPYQIAYFNELVGGARGAVGKYDLDYWGTSQKAAVLWINEHAPQNANVHIVMAAAVAGQYLRPDLLAHLNKYGYDASDFVVLLNRQSFFYRFFYAYEYLLSHRPVHTISVAGAPLAWIYDNRSDNTIARQTPWWQDEDPCIIKYWRGEKP